LGLFKLPRISPIIIKISYKKILMFFDFILVVLKKSGGEVNAAFKSISLLFSFVYVFTLIEKINIIKIYENVLTNIYVQDIIYLS